jgi:hypothetical protein
VVQKREVSASGRASALLGLGEGWGTRVRDGDWRLEDGGVRLVEGGRSPYSRLARPLSLHDHVHPFAG